MIEFVLEMEIDTIHLLLSKYQNEMDEILSKSSLQSSEKQTIDNMMMYIISTINTRLQPFLIHSEENPSQEHLLYLQNEIMSVENEIQTIASTIETYRQYAQQELGNCTGNVNVNECVDLETKSNTKTSYRKSLQSTLGEEVKEIVTQIDNGLVKETGNEVRRTQRTIAVIEKEKNRELTGVDKVISNV